MAIDWSVRKTLNALLQELIRLRDRERCLRCGTTERLQMSHIYPKGKHRSMEFDPWNVKLLCYSCHFHWWHKHPMEAYEWIKTVRPEKEMARLKLMSQTTGHRMDPKLQAIYLKSEIARLKRAS